MADKARASGVEAPLTQEKVLYILYNGRNPRTDEPIQIPRRTGARCMDTEEIVREGIGWGYIKDKYPIALGAVNGYLATVKDLIGTYGYSVNLGNLLKLHLELTGTVPFGSTTLTSGNRLQLHTTVLKAMKPNRDDFSYSYAGTVDEFVKIDRKATYFGAQVAPGTVAKGSDIVLTGAKALHYKDDVVTVSWPGEDDETMSITLTYKAEGSSYTQMRLAWPSTLDAVALGTELTFTVKSYGGDAQNNPVTFATATARLVAAVA